MMATEEIAVTTEYDGLGVAPPTLPTRFRATIDVAFHTNGIGKRRLNPRAPNPRVPSV
jgi:hypothetical protein